jgi:hypothetical protein
MRRTLVLGLTTVLAAAAISGFGLAGASASPSTARTEHFQIMTTVATSRKLSVIATGRFTAGGVDIPGKTTDTAVFAAGSFKIKRHSTSFTATFNSRTCLLTETERGTYRLRDGTGTYAGIRGSGRYVTHILGVIRHDSRGACTHLAAPPIFQSVFTAQGPVSGLSRRTPAS